MNEVFTTLPKFYPWDTPQFWGILSSQHLCETSTDKKLSGEPLEPTEVSLKEQSLIQLQQRVYDLFQLMMNDMIVNGTRRLETQNDE
ncbi:MAG: hypothetical protein EOO61_04855 [Hymenobacter sp.]|nr:MAG: hypothetical protein EOO61_04855 [Hymenobacter sp.]